MTAQQIFTWIGNNLQLIVVGIIFVGPLIAKVLRNLAEARQKRQAKIERERRELDALRTGQRTEPVRPAPAARAPMAAPAPAPVPAKRPGQGPARTRLVRLPGGIVLEVPDETAAEPQDNPRADAEAQQQEARARQQEARRQRAEADRQRQEELRQRAQRTKQRVRKAEPFPPPPPAPDAPALANVAQPVGFAPPASAPRPAPARTAAPATVSRGTITFMGQPATREQLRRAIVMSEIFGRPASER